MTPVLAFGDDHSGGADACWQWIVSQRWDGWRLEVVTAQPPADFHPVPPEETELHPWKPDDPRPVHDGGFTEVEYLRAEVDPRVALIARNWDLVAVGPRGEDWLETVRLGSTADWLLRQPTSPLVIARKSAPVRRVVLAADGSAHAKRSVESLSRLPWIEGVVVRVVVVDDGRVEPEKALDQATETLSASGVQLETVTRSGKPTDVLVEEIDAIEADLVVMGARGHGRIKRLVLGSTTLAIAGSTECSLLVAHAEDDSDH